MIGRNVGLLLVGHGTRSPRGQEEFLELARLVQQRLPGVAVQPAFLELAQPTIAEGVARLAAAGVRQAVAVPLLLLAAGHAKQDIPAAVRAAVQVHPGLELELAGHLGCQDCILRLSAQRFEEAIGEDQEIALGDTVWLIVGRGNRDSIAQAEMAQFVELRQRWTPVGQARIAWLALAEPQLASILPQIAELRFPRVVVQPHLLFHGDLLETLESRVQAMAADWPGQRWLLTRHLGPELLVAEAIVARFLDVRAMRRAVSE